MGAIKHSGTVAYGNSTDYKIFRSVKDYGAKGDGSADDTAAINEAITDGNRCGKGCDSSTITPAVVYFPPGTYAVSSPLIQYYFTQMIGDANTLPTLKALPNFKGMAVIDSDPYTDNGVSWFTNQNNFYRQVRNFIIDLTAMPPTAGAGIHWQVAQATSLQNIVFNMAKGASSKQQGIFMDNGSGGFMADLVFNGGGIGAFFGNQQFTTRNMTFNGCQTAIVMNWNWLWNMKSLAINDCAVGIDMSSRVNVGSVIVQDVVFKNTPIGIKSGFQPGTATNGTLIVDNVDFTGCSTAAIQESPANTTLLAGGKKIASWVQGHGYTSGKNVTAKRSASGQIALNGPTSNTPTRPKSLVISDGTFFQRSKPQYNAVPASKFISVKSKGAKGDGTSDDTKHIQAVFDSATADQVVFFDHGAYLVTDTVKVPKNIRITGEIWPMIVADGSSPAFKDASNPKPVFAVGSSSDSGAVEISDLVFQTKGPAPGAIMLQWNSNAASQGSNGLWDTHFRIGGSAGSGLQSDTCKSRNGTQHPANPKCEGAFMLLHVTKAASLYMENNWGWVADHELDLSDHSQIDIYNGRGALFESAEGPVWAYGSAFEHSQLYNYQISGGKNYYLGAIQTETPYWQSNPTALTPFKPDPKFNDPTFAACTTNACKKAWGLRVVDSADVHVYGAGLYSFFDDYSQDCLATNSCQDNMVAVENCTSAVYLWGLSTKAAVNMVTLNGVSMAKQNDNMNNFCQTVAVFEAA